MGLGLAGSIAGGYAADRIGARRVAGLATSLLGLTWIGFSLLAPFWHSKLLVAAALLLTELFAGAMSVSLFSLFMGISWPAVAATQFTAYMALVNLSKTAGAKLVGPLREFFPMEHLYFVLGVFQLLVIVLLLRSIDPHETRRVLGNGEERPAPVPDDEHGLGSRRDSGANPLAPNGFSGKTS